MDESRMLFARAARRALIGPLTSATHPGWGRESWSRLTTRPRPAARPVFAHLFFPCSVPKAPDNDLFRTLEIPCSAPASPHNRRVVKPTTP